MLLSPRVQLYDAQSLRPEGLAPGVLALPQLKSTAFGDGTHPTTRLCAGVLDWHCRIKKPERVLDVGTGSGVLARIARARGVQHVVGTDIDETALAVARRNAALDSGLKAILFESASPDAWGATFDFVVANILEGTLKELAPSLARALTPGGLLCLSGFTPLQIPSLRVVFERVGLQFESVATLEDWSLLLMRA